MSCPSLTPQTDLLRARLVLLDCSRPIDRHLMQHLVQQLQGPVQMHLDPAGRFFDRLSGIVGAPTLHERQSQDAEASQIVHPDASRRGKT